MFEDVKPNSERWLNLKDLPNEVWKEIKGYKRYMISNYGRVKSLEKTSNVNGRTYPTKILKNHTDTKRYFDVELCENGMHRKCRVHRLVAEAFINNEYNKPQVNHIDCNKQNNTVRNLEWCDNSENQIHAFANGLNHRGRYGASPKAKRVNQYDKNGNLIREWDSIKRIYDECGYYDSFISQCCKGKYKQAYGYIWKYKEEI